MRVEAEVTVNGPKGAVWAVITDIENAADTISGIEELEVLEKPDSGLVGLKWRETRTMFGKAATEEMWITDAVENDFYTVRAESHGCIYTSSMSVSERDGGSALTMTHESSPQGFLAKLLFLATGFLAKNAIRKVILQDLNDIKAAVEARP
jgi:hypothetical protein